MSPKTHKNAMQKQIARKIRKDINNRFKTSPKRGHLGNFFAPRWALTPKSAEQRQPRFQLRTYFRVGQRSTKSLKNALRGDMCSQFYRNSKKPRKATTKRPKNGPKRQKCPEKFQTMHPKSMLEKGAEIVDPRKGNCGHQRPTEGQLTTERARPHTQFSKI